MIWLLQFETVRIGLALAGLLLASYYDLFNRRNVPNWLTYSMLALGFLLNVGTLDFQLVLWSSATALVVFAVGYLFYRAGQLGGADVLIFAALALLLPEAPTPLLPSGGEPLFTYPFILSIFVLSGAFSIVGVSLRSVPAVLDALASGKARLDPASAVLALSILFSYAVALNFLNQTFGLPLAQTLLLASLALLTSFLVLFREQITDSMVDWVPLREIEEEDVLAVDKLDKELVRRHGLQRVLTPGEVEKLRRTGLKKFPVFKRMPPFVPYILLALLALAMFGDPIRLFFG